MATNTPTMTPTTLPKLNGNPLSWIKWWVTPRNTEKNPRFRERVLRWTVLTIMIMLLATLPMSHNIGWDSTQIVRHYTNMLSGILTLLVVGVLIHKNRILMAGWAIVIVMALAYIRFMPMSYWTQISAFVLLILISYAQISLPRRHIWVANTLAIIVALLPILVQVPTPSDLVYIQSFIQPKSVTMTSIFFLLVIMSMLILLRREFDSQLDEIKEWSTTLEKQVRERTAELQVATQTAIEARHEAEEANKTKSQFLANMSHELRTPLNAILNFTAFVADGVMGSVNDEQEDMLRQSIGSGNHLLALINDILDITKIEAGLMDLFIQDVDMNEILASVASVGKGLVKDKDITLNLDIEDNLPTTYGDKRRLRQVFLNILSNAVKFTSEGEVSIRAKSINNGIHVAIHDTGIGIAPEDLTLVFQSFKQIKHNVHEAIGTGLGMPISKYFIESHQGKIWIESELGKGSTFYVELPTLTKEEADTITMNVKEQI